MSIQLISQCSTLSIYGRHLGEELVNHLLLSDGLGRVLVPVDLHEEGRLLHHQLSPDRIEQCTKNLTIFSVCFHDKSSFFINEMSCYSMHLQYLKYNIFVCLFV